MLPSTTMQTGQDSPGYFSRGLQTISHTEYMIFHSYGYYIYLGLMNAFIVINMPTGLVLGSAMVTLTPAIDTLSLKTVSWR